MVLKHHTLHLSDGDTLLFLWPLVKIIREFLMMIKAQTLVAWVHILQLLSSMTGLAKIIQEEVIEKTIHAMKSEGILFKGFLYAGIMIQRWQAICLGVQC